MLSDFSPESFSMSSTSIGLLPSACPFSGGSTLLDFFFDLDLDFDLDLPLSLSRWLRFSFDFDRDLDRFFSFLSFFLLLSRSLLRDLLFFFERGSDGVLLRLPFDRDRRRSFLLSLDLDRFLLRLLDFDRDRFLSTSTLSLLRSLESTDFSLDLDLARAFRSFDLSLSRDFSRSRDFLRSLDLSRDDGRDFLASRDRERL